MDGVRVILFPPFRPAPSSLERDDLLSVFEARFVDGRGCQGRSRWMQADEHGVHLLRAGQGWLQRLLLPWAALVDFALHPSHALGEEQRAVPGEGPAAAAKFVLLEAPRPVPPEASSVQVQAPGLPRSAEAPAASSSSDDKSLRERDLAARLGLDFIDLRGLEPDPTVVSEVPADYCRTYCAMPLSLHEGRVRVAMADPTQVEATSLLQFLTGKRLDIVVATASQIRSVIEKTYSPLSSTDDITELDMAHARASEGRAERERDQLEALSMQKPIVRLVSSIILEGIRRRASDIHIRPGEHDVELVFRIDGEMVLIRRFPRSLLAGVISRVKIIGGMDITERRIPQDGQTRVRDQQRVVDLRISIIPTIEGESVVLRILNSSVEMRGIGELGLSDRDYQVFRDSLHRSSGLVLVTGPTGSGKSTTLYSGLRTVIERGVNIITVENPVEFHIPGIEQVPINAELGLTFAKALRNILRHDPDVILVGEIRDQETAKIAVEASLTGHLVLSTLHTNSASRSIARLLEMGVDSFLLRATLLCVLAQRLVRQNCPDCRRPEAPDPVYVQALGVRPDEMFQRGAGCETCDGVGLRGRRMTYELLAVDQELRKLVAEGIPSEQIDAVAVQGGMVPLTQHALSLAREGHIPLSEVYRTRLE